MLFTNTCQYNGCGKIFENLSNLICHIERFHLDFSKENLQHLEKDKPEAIPFSYVLRCFNKSDCMPQDSILKSSSNNQFDFVDIDITILGDSLLCDKEMNCWDVSKNPKAYSKRKGLINDHLANVPHQVSHKPFLCIIPGCKKRYKNANGMRYHYKNNHGKLERSKKLEKVLTVFKMKSTNIRQKHKFAQVSGFFETPTNLLFPPSSSIADYNLTRNPKFPLD